MDPIQQFREEIRTNVDTMSKDEDLKKKTKQWMKDVSQYKYSYNFSWLGRPIIQFPQEIMALQEIIWKVKPDLIIETGIAHGGSLIFYASMIHLLENSGQVIGIDIDIRKHNRGEIEKHPMAKYIQMIEGPSTDRKVFDQVQEFARNKERILVILDSNHTHDHVLEELNLYAPLITKDSYLIVLDTIVEDLPEVFSADRPWGKGNNPKTAVWEFLKTNNRFIIDREIEEKLLVTVAPDGYLKCIE